jgi:hypothetical protein
MTMGDSFDVYEADGHPTVRHILFRRKHAWEPLKVVHRLTAAAKHIIRRKKQK